MFKVNNYRRAPKPPTNDRPTIILLGEALNSLVQSADSYVDHGDTVVNNIQVLDKLNLDLEYSKGLLEDLKLGAFYEGEV